MTTASIAQDIANLRLRHTQANSVREVTQYKFYEICGEGLMVGGDMFVTAPWVQIAGEMNCCIMRCSPISSWRSATTSETVKHCCTWVPEWGTQVIPHVSIAMLEQVSPLKPLYLSISKLDCVSWITFLSVLSIFFSFWVTKRRLTGEVKCVYSAQ